MLRPEVGRGMAVNEVNVMRGGGGCTSRLGVEVEQQARLMTAGATRAGFGFGFEFEFGDAGTVSVSVPGSGSGRGGCGTGGGLGGTGADTGTRSAGGGRLPPAACLSGFDKGSRLDRQRPLAGGGNHSRL